MVNTDWTHTPFYVVGNATAASLSEIREVAGHTLLAPVDIRGAAESGTSEKLAHFILEDLPAARPTKLLYLTGDKNRDTMPSILREGGVELQFLQAYATQGSSTFAADLRQALSRVARGGSLFTVQTNCFVVVTSLIAHFA